MLISALFTILQFYFVQAQIACYSGVVVYEKSSAAVVHSIRADRTLEISPTEAPTPTCLRICDGTPSCTAFTVDYSTKTCKTYSVTMTKTQLTFKPDTAFFEKNCLPDIPRDLISMKCGSRLWQIERVAKASFQGSFMRTDKNVSSREHCARSCIAEVNFDCASAVYDETTKICSLSAENRRTSQNALVENVPTSDYMENQCTTAPRNCQYLRQNNIDVLSIDHVSDANSQEQCENECTTNNAIVCRSYSYDLQRNKCELSSDDSVSLQGIELLKDNGKRYAERRCQISISPQQLFLGNNINNQQFPQLPNYGSMMPAGFPQQSGGGIYPGVSISRFDQFETQDPRFFLNTMNRQTPGSNAYGPRISSERCYLEKSTGLSVVAERQSIIPIAGFFTRGITSICSSWCRMQGPIRCSAFTVDYNSNRCSVLPRPAEVAVAPGMSHGQSYLEHVCFNDYYTACQGKMWAFERMVNMELQGFDDKVLSTVQSRKDCEEACLSEIRFQCLSAEYDSSRNECRLSRENRLTKPFSIQPAYNVDYLENQCIQQNVLGSCAPQRQTGFTILYADASLTQIFSEEECRRACSTFSNFTCNVASYRQIAGECLLSSDATTVPLPDAILLYSTCVLLKPATPPLSTAFGQVPNVPTDGPNFNSFQPQFHTPSATSFPNNQLPSSGLPPNFNTNFNGTNGLMPTYNNPQTHDSLFPGININAQRFPPSDQPFPSSNQFPNYGQQFPNSRPQFPTSGAPFPSYGQQFPISGQHFPSSGQPFPSSGQPFPNSGQQFPSSGQQFPSSGQQFPSSGQQFPSSGQQFPSSEQQFPSSGQQFPSSGQQFPSSGQQFPSSGQQFPSSGQQFPSSGQSFPSSGQQFPSSGQPFPSSGQFPISGRPFASSGQVFSNSGQPFPSAGQLFPGSGQFPSSGQSFPGSGQQFPSSGQIPSFGQLPNYGQFPIPGHQYSGFGQQFPSSGQQFLGSGQTFPGSGTSNSGFFPITSTQRFPGSSLTSFTNTAQNPLGFQRPFSTQPPFLRPNRDFLHQQQTPSIPLLIPGRSTTVTSKPELFSQNNQTGGSSLAEEPVEALKKNPTKKIPFTTDSQPK